MKKLIPTFILGFIVLLLANQVYADGGGHRNVNLHTNDKWDSCAMVIDPGLTQSAFKGFTKDISSIAYFKPMAGARTLGQSNISISLDYHNTGRIDDESPKWNDTFSHPEEDHYLTGDNRTLGFPVIHGKIGIDDNMDIGFYFTHSITSNYGFAGLEFKYAFMQESSSGFAAATRLSYSTLLGVADMNYNQGAVDLLVSFDIGSFQPYGGIGGSYSYTNETTSKVDLKPVHSAAVHGIVGAQVTWKYVNIGLEANFAKLNVYSFKLGTVF